MKKLLSSILFVALFIISPVYAGHDFMQSMRQGSALIKQESCSNNKTMIEHRLVRMAHGGLLLTLVILEPDAASRRSQWYSEENKDFYSLIFYKMSDVKDATKTSYLIKKVQSGDVTEVTASQWLKEINMVDSSAAKSLAKQPGSDCHTTPDATTR